MDLSLILEQADDQQKVVYQFTVVVLSAERLPMMLSKTPIAVGRPLRLSKLLGCCHERPELLKAELKQRMPHLAIGLHVSNPVPGGYEKLCAP